MILFHNIISQIINYKIIMKHEHDKCTDVIFGHYIVSNFIFSLGKTLTILISILNNESK